MAPISPEHITSSSVNTQHLSTYYQTVLEQFQRGNTSAQVHNLLKNGLSKHQTLQTIALSTIQKQYKLDLAVINQLQNANLVVQNSPTTYTLFHANWIDVIHQYQLPVLSNQKIAGMNKSKVYYGLGFSTLVLAGSLVGSIFWGHNHYAQSKHKTKQIAVLQDAIQEQALSKQGIYKALKVQEEINSLLLLKGADKDLAVEQLISQYQVKIDKTPLESWYALGLLYKMQGQNAEKEISCYKQVLNLNPSFNSAYLNRAEAYLSVHKYDKALVDYKKVLLEMPEDLTALKGLAKTYQYQENYSEALSTYKKVLQLNPNDEYAWKNKADIYSVQGKYEMALKAYSNALQINPYDEIIWNARGNVQAFLNDYDKSLKDYNKALSINPTAEYILANREQVLKQSEQPYSTESISNTQGSKPSLELQTIQYSDNVTAFNSGDEPVTSTIRPVEKVVTNPIQTPIEEDPVVAAPEEENTSSETTASEENISTAETKRLAFESKQRKMIGNANQALTDFWWLMGQWETEAINGMVAKESWTVNDQNSITGTIILGEFRETWLVRYESAKDQIFLEAPIDGSKSMVFELAELNDQKIIFKLVDSQQKQSNSIVFSRRPNGGFLIKILADKGKFSRKQSKYLNKINLVKDQEAIRKLRPSASGKL